MADTFLGLPAAPGIGIGRLFIYGHTIPDSPSDTAPADLPVEWARFLHAQAEVDAELANLDEHGNPLVAEIFSAHRVILQDTTLVNAIRARIEAGQSAAHATHQVIEELSIRFRELDDAYFASRSQDILDIGRRLLRRLDSSTVHSLLHDLPEQTILVAHDLTPSEVAELSADHVTAIILANSTPTAHSAILARSLGIPLACSFGESILDLPLGEMAIADGDNGVLWVAPTEADLQRFREVRHRQVEIWQAAEEQAHRPAFTGDGVCVPVYVNANSPADVHQSVSFGADGVGLLRTEYLFQHRSTPPTCQEQQEVYRTLATHLADRLLTIRALDAGGDKPVDYVQHLSEENPFLGLRGIRLLLAYPELLQTQFQAILAVARELGDRANFRFMLPMISTATELDAARRLLDELLALEPDDRASVKIGVLVEVPAAALLARHLAKSIDFFSIGTNDLAQYVLASDRTNSRVASMADPLHPAVLQMIKMTCTAAAESELPVSLCGEVAGEPAATPLLLGLGVTELSVPLPATPLIKQAVRGCDMIQARQLAEQALACPDAESVRRLLAR
ncbi:MAG: phosphoenolpyruvate--protein phosphotransferase [Caldilineaceae bacterium]|nr:phosphoenolpyruvate--protein phosphotransferase [Caldilineaceae bacterium]